MDTLEPRDGDAAPAQIAEISLVDIVSKADKLMLEGGLEKLGVAKEYIEKIRNLDGLAESNGKFLSASLETIHRMYFLQLVQLFGISEALQKRLAAKPGEDGYLADDEARAWFNKNYIEMVKESGNGYSLMMDGAQAMVRMMIAAGDAGGAPGKKRKPGFNKMLSVKPEATAASV